MDEILKMNICTRQEFVDTYGKLGVGEKRAAVLDEYGIFPVSYRNPILSRLNVLGLYVYFSGSLRTYAGNKYTGTISKGRTQQHDIDSIIESELGLKLRKRIPKKEKKTDNLEKRYDIDFGTNGGSYARLLSLMGFFTSNGVRSNIARKSRHGSELPKYLTDLIENYDKLAPWKKEKYKRLLRDMIAVCFETKTYVKQRQNRFEYVELELLTQPSLELVEKQGRQIIRAFNIVYPKVELKEEQMRWRKVKSHKKQFVGHIEVTLEQAIMLQSDPVHAVSIGLQARVLPSRYSFE